MKEKTYDPKYFNQWRQRQLSKLGTHCAICASTENLEIDHIIEEDKAFDISSRWTYFYDSFNEDRQAELDAELIKCQLLCNKCHKEKTREYLSKLNLEIGFTHGTFYAFRVKNCTYTICQDSKIKYDDIRNSQRRKSDGHGPIDKSPECGTRKKYRKGCKCLLCKEANAKYTQVILQNKKSKILPTDLSKYEEQTYVIISAGLQKNYLPNPKG